MIGPQLDGIGGWGSRALATKILDPNRNISESFRQYTIKLKSGEVKTGLLRHEGDKALVFADATGKEFVVARQNIDQIQASRHTTHHAGWLAYAPVGPGRVDFRTTMVVWSTLV